MKKTYKTPSVEVVKFQYSDQIVAASIAKGTYWDTSGDEQCDTPKDDLKP